MASPTLNTQLFALYAISTDQDQDPASFSGVALLSPTVTSTLLDLTSDNRFGLRAFTPRRIWIDNSASGISITVTVPGTGQVIVAKANTQGIYPLIAQDSESGANFKCNISGVPAALVSIPIQVMNVDIAPYTWATV